MNDLSQIPAAKLLSHPAVAAAVEALRFYGDADKWMVLKDFSVDLTGFDLGDVEETKAAQVLKLFESDGKIG